MGEVNHSARIPAEDEGRRVRILRYAAVLSYFVGYFYMRYCIGGRAVFAGPVFAFTLLFIAGVEALSALLGHGPAAMRARGCSLFDAWFCAACAVAQAAAILVWGLHAEPLIGAQIFFWHFTLIYYVYARTGMLAAGRTGVLFPVDAAVSMFWLPWANLFLRVKSLFARRGQADSAEKGIAENSIAENSIAEKGIAENSIAENSSAEKDRAEKGIAENSIAENSSAEKGIAENSSAEKNSVEKGCEGGDESNGQCGKCAAKPGADRSDCRRHDCGSACREPLCHCTACRGDGVIRGPWPAYSGCIFWLVPRELLALARHGVSAVVPAVHSGQRLAVWAVCGRPAAQRGSGHISEVQ